MTYVLFPNKIYRFLHGYLYRQEYSRILADTVAHRRSKIPTGTHR